MPSQSPRDVVFPPGRQALYEKNRYSPAIRSNGFLFVSGQVGSRPDGSPEPDLQSQVRLPIANNTAESPTCSQLGLSLSTQIYGNGLKPNSFKKPLCFCLAAAMVFSISTNSRWVASRSISASPTAVLM